MTVLDDIELTVFTQSFDFDFDFVDHDCGQTKHGKNVWTVLYRAIRRRFHPTRHQVEVRLRCEKMNYILVIKLLLVALKLTTVEYDGW